MPRVSILIGIYNGEATLDRMFQSIQGQTFTDYEIICIDDCSTDETPKLLARWKVSFEERFRTERNVENQGLTRTLNKALSNARSEYIARIDADDFWEPMKLEKQVAFLDKHSECGIVGTNLVNIYTNNPSRKYVRLPETHTEIAQKLFRRNPFAHSAVLARTKFIRQVGGYDPSIRYGQDYELWLRCFPLTHFHNLQEFLCVRSISPISTQKQNAQMRQSIRTRLKYMRKYRSGLRSYLYLLEPVGVILAPTFIKNLKRRYI